MASNSRICFQFTGPLNKDGLPNGKGTITFLESCLYFGWEYTPDCILSGSFTNGQLTGTGYIKTFYSNGPLIYEGQWERGELIQGSLKYPQGAVFTGRFKNYYPINGTLRYANGQIYTGEMSNDMPHGQGTLTEKTGHIYVGRWEDGVFRKGQLTYPNGKICIGVFNDLFPIQGQIKYKTGSLYQGEIRKDNPHGQGTYTASNGGTYVEQFHNDDFISGQFNSRQGYIYTGQFDRFRPIKGRLDTGEGWHYIGHFKDYQPHGQGQLTFDTTNIEFEGVFDKGRISFGLWKNRPYTLNSQLLMGKMGYEINDLIQSQSHLSGLRKVNQSKLKIF